MHGNESILKQEGFGVLKGFCSLSGVHRDGASVPPLMSHMSSWIRFPKRSAFEI